MLNSGDQAFRNRKSTVKNRIYIPRTQEKDKSEPVESLNLIVPNDKETRVKRYMGELEKRAHVLELEKDMQKKQERQTKAKTTVVDLF